MLKIDLINIYLEENDNEIDYKLIMIKLINCIKILLQLTATSTLISSDGSTFSGT